MIDRFGREIEVGWPAHHIIWLEAAWSLPSAERDDALREIAELTGRSFAACYFKGKSLRERARDGKRRAALIAFAQAHGAVLSGADNN